VGGGGDGSGEEGRRENAYTSLHQRLVEDSAEHVQRRRNEAEYLHRRERRKRENLRRRRREGGRRIPQIE